MIAIKNHIKRHPMTSKSVNRKSSDPRSTSGYTDDYVDRTEAQNPATKAELDREFQRAEQEELFPMPGRGLVWKWNLRKQPTRETGPRTAA
jgi:hypothetical protein